MELSTALVNEYIASIGAMNYALGKEIAEQKKRIEEKDEYISDLKSKYKHLNEDIGNRLRRLAPMAERISTCEYTDGTVETIVAWDDGTATTVHLAKGEENDPYNAFCAALAKRLYGTNSAVKRIVHAESNAHFTGVKR